MLPPLCRQPRCRGLFSGQSVFRIAHTCPAYLPSALPLLRHYRKAKPCIPQHGIAVSCSEAPKQRPAEKTSRLSLSFAAPSFPPPTSPCRLFPAPECAQAAARPDAAGLSTSKARSLAKVTLPRLSCPSPAPSPRLLQSILIINAVTGKDTSFRPRPPFSSENARPRAARRRPVATAVFLSSRSPRRVTALFTMPTRNTPFFRK